VISDQLGHASVQITMDRYSHLFDGAYSDVNDELEQAWKDTEGSGTIQTRNGRAGVGSPVNGYSLRDVHGIAAEVHRTYDRLPDERGGRAVPPA
jgi:hypothetical protein